MTDGDPTFFFLKPFAWLNATDWEDKILGAFLKTYADPTKGSVPDDRVESESHLKYNHFNLHERDFNTFTLDSHGSEKKEASIALQSLTELSFTGEKSHAHMLDGKKISLKRLTQIDVFFKEAKEDGVVKSRVVPWVKPGSQNPVCLVVGIMMCEEASVDWQQGRQRGLVAKGSIPFGKLAQAAAGAPPETSSDAIGDLKAQFSEQEEDGGVFKTQASGKQIFALELRVITRGRWVKRDRLEMSEKGPSGAHGRFFGLEEGKEPEIDDDDLFCEEIDFVS